MSSYLIHSRELNRNQFRVLFDWFDFIHRCFFHSRWSCFLNQKYFRHWIYTVHSIPLHSMIIGYSMLTLFVQNPAPSFLVIDLGSNHPSTRFHHFITTQTGLASMIQSFVLSILRMKIRDLWEIKDLNWVNRVWFNVQNRNVLYLIIL